MQLSPTAFNHQSSNYKKLVQMENFGHFLYADSFMHVIPHVQGNLFLRTAQSKSVYTGHSKEQMKL